MFSVNRDICLELWESIRWAHDICWPEETTNTTIIIIGTGKATLISLWITEDSPYGLILVETDPKLPLWLLLSRVHEHTVSTGRMRPKLRLQNHITKIQFLDPSVWLCISYLPTLCLSPLICEMEMITVSNSYGYCENWLRSHLKRTYSTWATIKCF